MELTAGYKVNRKTNQPFICRIDKYMERRTCQQKYQIIDEIESSKYCESRSIIKGYKHGFHFHGLRRK